MVVAIFKLLLQNNLVGHKTKLVGPVPQCAPPWLRHCQESIINRFPEDKVHMGRMDCMYEEVTDTRYSVY